jgi:hypothetical protein
MTGRVRLPRHFVPRNDGAGEIATSHNTLLAMTEQVDGIPTSLCSSECHPLASSPPPQSILHPYLVPPSGLVVYLNIFFYSPMLHYCFFRYPSFFQLFSFDLVNKEQRNGSRNKKYRIKYIKKFILYGI